MRRSVPASTARDALTHITSKKDEPSWATYGKHADAGVIHSGRNALASSGRAYDESCARAQTGGGGERRVRRQAVQRHATYCESRGPAVEPRGELGVLVGVDCPWWRTQVKIETEIRRLGCRDVQRRGCFGEAAQACGAIDDGTPDRHCLGERIREELACTRRIYKNKSGTKSCLFRGKVRRL